MSEESIHPNEAQAIPIGAAAPDFTLRHWNGAPHTLSAAWAAAPVVLIFYRGDW